MFTKEDLARVDKEYDFSALDLTEKELKFAKYLILENGIAYKAASHITTSKARNWHDQLGGMYLRRLRAHPNFFDILGLGYGSLSSVVKDLKKRNPAKAADVIMKLNKEDTQEISGNLIITIAGELKR